MKMHRAEDRVILEPDQPANACVIWLHGLGADGNDFVPIVPELKLPADAGVRFVFPHAPIQPVTINGGMKMRAWFDIYHLGSLDKQDELGINASSERVKQLIQEQNAAGIPTERIVLAGFSQGGAIAIHTMMRLGEPLAGLLALSTFMPLHTRAAEEHVDVNIGVPIMMCHGTHDPVLPMGLGEWSRDLLTEFGYTVDWKSYPMAHQVCPQQIADISLWLNKVLFAK